MIPKLSHTEGGIHPANHTQCVSSRSWYALTIDNESGPVNMVDMDWYYHKANSFQRDPSGPALHGLVDLGNIEWRSAVTVLSLLAPSAVGLG